MQSSQQRSDDDDEEEEEEEKEEEEEPAVNGLSIAIDGCILIPLQGRGGVQGRGADVGFSAAF